MTTSDTDMSSMSSFSMQRTSEFTPVDTSLLPTDSDVGVGLSGVALNVNRRKMLDLVNKLIMTGQVLPSQVFAIVDSPSRVQVDIDLPRIAVIGSQSAGKSSLIESISGITLPRASGTCTRFVVYSVLLTPCPGSIFFFLTIGVQPSAGFPKATLSGSAQCPFAAQQMKMANLLANLRLSHSAASSIIRTRHY